MPTKTQKWEHKMFGEKIANQILHKEISKLGTGSEERKNARLHQATSI